MEKLEVTSKPAPLIFLGIKFPKLLSFLAHGDFDSEVAGLNSFPKETWPPFEVVHISFEIMILIGTAMALFGAFSLIIIFKNPIWIESKALLKLICLLTPFGFLAIEAGWTVTEVGRQPWIIYGILKTKEALTPMPGLVYPMSFFIGIYLLLGFVVTWLMMRQFKSVS